MYLVFIAIFLKEWCHKIRNTTVTNIMFPTPKLVAVYTLSFLKNIVMSLNNL